MLSRLGALGVAALLAGVAVPASASAAPAGRPAAPTTEEARLDRAAPQEILRKSGFDSVAPEFSEALKKARSYDHARRLVVREGQSLWRRAVDRPRGSSGPASARTTTGRCTGRGSG